MRTRAKESQINNDSQRRNKKKKKKKKKKKVHVNLAGSEYRLDVLTI